MQKYNEGLYLVDKPSGPSSHDVVGFFRRESGIKRVGHCGTLDPLASGLLIILVGREFTKKQSLYLKKDKTYLVTARLGLKTDSYDITGEIVEEKDWSDLKEITKEDLEGSLESFKGKIEQEVPIFSAVKVNGQKLYQKARKGQTVEKLPSRMVEIKKLKLIDFQRIEEKKEISFTLEVECSSGTYIRSLINDIGQKLELGATITNLRRTKIDKFDVKNAITMNGFHVKKRV